MHICAPSRKTANLTVFKTAFKTIEFSQTLEFSEKKKILVTVIKYREGFWLFGVLKRIE